MGRPTSPGSLALVTSRRRLTGLDGVHPESLPVLGEQEAITLLARIAGERVFAEPEAAAQVIRRCGGLPLAIRLAGARLAHRSRWRVADLVRRLGEAALPELAAEDRTVAGAFALSYGQLPERTQRMFRLHDLLREYAAALAAELPAAERRTALTQVLDLQLHAAAATVSAGHRILLDRDLRSPRPERPDLLAELADPAARLERERRSLAGYLEAAVAAELFPYAWQIVRASWRYLWYRGYLDDIVDMHERALLVTARIGDRSATATITNYLSSVYFIRAEMVQASRLLMQSIQIRGELGELDAMATAMGNLSGIYHNMGRWTESIELIVAAQRISPNRCGPTESNTRLNVLGLSCVRLGRYAEALYYLRLRLMCLIDLKDLALSSDCVTELTALKCRMGLIEPETARRQIRLALRLAVRSGYWLGQSNAQNQLARLACLDGLFAEAIEGHQTALDMSLQWHSRMHEAMFRCDFAATLVRSGDVSGAAAMLQDALRVSRAAQLPYYIALAQAGLAECAAHDDPDEARRLWAAALETFRELSAPERFEVERRLTDLDGDKDQLRIRADGETITA